MLKAAGVDELMTAIRTVHSGDVYIHSPMATKLVGDYVNRLRGGQGDDLYEKLSVSPNPPKDTDGRREESGRGVRELQGK